MVSYKGVFMKTLDQIINQIHQEQEQHNLKVINERNLYMEELEKKYSSEDFLASYIFDADTEELFKGTKEGFMLPYLNAVLFDYMSPKALHHLSNFKEALERACSGSYIKWEKNVLAVVNADAEAGGAARGPAETVLEFNSIDSFRDILECSFSYHKTSEGRDYWKNVEANLAGYKS